MPEKIVRQNVAFEPQDMQTVYALAHAKGLGPRGFSAAVRMIIREWQQHTAQQAAIEAQLRAATQQYINSQGAQ